MPESDLRFVHLPTEIDELTAAQSGKVKQAEVEIFDDAAVGLNLLDQRDQFCLQFLCLAILNRRALRTARICDHQLCGLRFEQLDSKVAPLAYQIFDERPQHRQQRRRLFEAEYFHAVVLPYRLPRPLFPIGGATSGRRQIPER